MSADGNSPAVVEPPRAELDAYHALTAYTLTHGDPAFIHQHVVDAFAAQHAHAGSKPIGVTFALAGLYLLLERQFSGRHVQRAHMQMAQRKRTWPTLALPAARGSLTALDVMAQPEGAERDRAIYDWCASVWGAYRGNGETIAALLREYGIIQ